MKNKRTPSKIVNALFFVLAALCITYYIVNGVYIRFVQSLLWVWPVVSALCLLRFALVRRMIKTGKRSPIPGIVLKIGHSIIAVLLVCFIIVEGIILSAASTSANMDADAVIVLGAKVNGEEPSGTLRNRIVYAYEYLSENERAICIASGGQGADEGISEAQCIYNELTRRGIDGSRIILEDKSTSTKENLKFSLDMLTESEQNIVIITNNFHVYRALKVARETDARRDFTALPVATSFLSLPHFMVREFAAVVVGAITGSITD